MWKWELGIPIPDENLLCWLWHLVYPVSFNRQCLCYGDWRIMGKTMRTVLYHIVLCSCAHFIITLLWAVLTGGCGLFLCVYFVSFSYLRPVCVLCFICFFAYSLLVTLSFCQYRCKQIPGKTTSSMTCYASYVPFMAACVQLRKSLDSRGPCIELFVSAMCLPVLLL